MLRCGREHSIIRLSIFSGGILSHDNSNEKNCEIIEWINCRNKKMYHDITQHWRFFKFTRFSLEKTSTDGRLNLFFKLNDLKELLEWKNLGTKRWKEIAILSPIPFFFFFSETIYYVFIIRIILLFLKIETFYLTFSYFEIKIFDKIF